MGGGGGGVVAACSQHSHELSSVWSFICVCVVKWSCCVTTCWLGVGGESGENKTVHSILLLVSEPGRRGVGHCSMSSSAQEGVLYLIEGVGDCKE